MTLERRRGPVEETPCRVVLRDTGEAPVIAPWDGTGSLSVENGRRTIKRLFADAGIPVERRAEHPAVLLGGKTAAVFGVAVDWTSRAGAGEDCWSVTLRAAGGSPAAE